MKTKDFYDETGSNWTATDRDTNYDPNREPDAVYEYLTPEGEYAYEVQRQDVGLDGIKKGFRVGRENRTRYGARLSPEDNWQWKYGKGDHPFLLYRGKELRESDPSAPVWIAEGEKDADLLVSMGEVAVTNSNGFGNWQRSHSEQLKGRDCIICEDNDDRGRKRTKGLLRALGKVAKSVSLVRFNDMPAKYDVSDFFAAGGTLEALKEKVEDGFERDEKGKLFANRRNICLALDLMGVTVRYDEFQDRTLIDGLEDFGPNLDDAALVRLRLEAQEKFSLFVYKEAYSDIVTDLARRNKFHPVRDYLDGLIWDGTPRLDEWLIAYGEAEDTEYVRAVGALTLIAAVRRVRQPGCKFDEMLILESPQGKNKSSALSVLAKKEEWFTDELPLNQDTKGQIENMAGRWIIEAAELTGMRKGDVEHLKAFLSRRVDRARLAYARLPVEVPRQCIFVGTSNSNQYLRDGTGNRRYWPVEVQEFDLEALKRDVDQLWAEAALREAKGESIRLKEDLWKSAAEEQEARQIEDPFVELLREVLQNKDGKIKSTDVFQALGIQPEKRTQDHNSRVGAAMRELGFKRKKIRFDGDSVWGYQRGDASKELEVPF